VVNFPRRVSCQSVMRRVRGDADAICSPDLASGHDGLRPRELTPSGLTPARTARKGDTFIAGKGRTFPDPLLPKGKRTAGRRARQDGRQGLALFDFSRAGNRAGRGGASPRSVFDRQQNWFSLPQGDRTTSCDSMLAPTGRPGSDGH